MREIDFLPDAYRQTVRQRKRLVTQGWVALGLLSVLGLRIAASLHHTTAAAAEVTRLHARIDEAESQAQEVDRLAALRSHLLKQEQRVQRLGVHVDTSRLLAALDEAMPGGVSLVDLQIDTEERPSTTAPADGLRERHLRVRLEGLATTAAEQEKFVARLTAVPFIEQVKVGFSKDGTEGGRSIRQFDLTFSINLNHPM